MFWEETPCLLELGAKNVNSLYESWQYLYYMYIPFMDVLGLLVLTRCLAGNLFLLIEVPIKWQSVWLIIIEAYNYKVNKWYRHY